MMTMESDVWRRNGLALAVVGILSQAPRSGADVHRVLCDRLSNPPDRSTVYRTLRRLEEDGYVTERDSGSNERSQRYGVTSEGAKRVRVFTANVVGWLDDSRPGVADLQR